MCKIQNDLFSCWNRPVGEDLVNYVRLRFSVQVCREQQGFLLR
jgi:hypothetical protein